jgi:hypothetical protein
MSRTQTIAFIAVVLLAALIGVLAVRSRQPPVLPPDADHARFINHESCLSCHGPGAKSPYSENHTPRTDCMHCHGMP